MTSPTTEKKSIWPDKLMIRDTGLYDDLGGLGQRIYTTAGQGYEKRNYIRADLVALNQGPRRDDGVGSNPDLSAQDRLPSSKTVSDLFQLIEDCANAWVASAVANSSPLYDPNAKYLAKDARDADERLKNAVRALCERHSAETTTESTIFVHIGNACGFDADGDMIVNWTNESRDPHGNELLFVKLWTQAEVDDSKKRGEELYQAISRCVVEPPTAEPAEKAVEVLYVEEINLHEHTPMCDSSGCIAVVRSQNGKAE